MKKKVFSSSIHLYAQVTQLFELSPWLLVKVVDKILKKQMKYVRLAIQSIFA